MEIWKAAICEGYSSSDARDMASLELDNKLFNDYDPNNNPERNGNNNSGPTNGITETISTGNQNPRSV